MPRFIIACRAALDDEMIARLGAEGVYWFGSSLSPVRPNWRRHYLRIESTTPDAALEDACKAVQAAGAEAAELTVIG